MQIYNPKSSDNCRFAIDISDIYHYTESMFDNEVNMELSELGLSNKALFALLSGSVMADLNETEMLMFFELLQHLFERKSSDLNLARYF